MSNSDEITLEKIKDSISILAVKINFLKKLLLSGISMYTLYDVDGATNYNSLA